jgi:gluconolactonase
MAPEIEIINYDKFRNSLVPSSRLEQLYTGMKWGEGPVYFSDGNYLLFSDIPNNRILRWVEGGEVSVFRSPSNFANGNTRDRQGRLITCESGTRRITRTELDGSITILVDQYEGKRLNSPNDVVVRSDGTIWFTDPPYGIASNYTGEKAVSELGCNHVFCFDPADRSLRAVINSMDKPNGLAFSPDEKTLYVSDTGATHDRNGNHHILAWDIDGYEATNSRLFTEITPGISDGFKVDEAGKIWSSAADGVHCYSCDGELIGKIRTPEVVTNLAFGGRMNSRLFIVTSSSLYTIFLADAGTPLFNDIPD